MNISPIGFFKTNNLPKTKQTIKYKTVFDCDTVSFSSSNIKSQTNSQTAAKLGQKIYEELSANPLASVKNIIQQEAPGLAVIPFEKVKDLVDNPEGYTAFFAHDISENFENISPEIYIKLDTNTKDHYSLLLYCNQIAHEFTHYLQSKKENIEFIKTISQDFDYIFAVEYFAHKIFQYFDYDLQNELVLPLVFKPDVENLFTKYGQVIPLKEGSVTKENLFNQNNKTQEEFEKEVQDKFEALFNHYFTKALNDKQLDKEIRKITKQALTIEDYEKLKQKVKECVKYLAKIEIESCQTESILTKTLMHTNDSLNIDYYTIYYEALYNAFSN